MTSDTRRSRQIADMKAELRLPLTAARRRDLNAMMREAQALETISEQVTAAKRRSVEALEDAWTDICNAAGYGPWVSCCPDLPRLNRYFAEVDRIAGEREAGLRALIDTARADPRQPYGPHYVDGIEAALSRAIRSPRQA